MHRTEVNYAPKVGALAGRRIDEPDSDLVQFPLANVSRVTSSIKNLFADEQLTHLVCSAACGADLISIEAAKLIGITVDIVLPYSSSKFRQTSVTDRPGEWGMIYDKIISEADINGRLHILGSDDEGNYNLVTEGIFDIAKSIAPQERLTGIIVWEGRPRSNDDATADFSTKAKKMDLKILEVFTC